MLKPCARAGCDLPPTHRVTMRDRAGEDWFADECQVHAEDTREVARMLANGNCLAYTVETNRPDWRLQSLTPL